MCYGLRMSSHDFIMSTSEPVYPLIVAAPPNGRLIVQFIMDEGKQTVLECKNMAILSIVDSNGVDVIAQAKELGNLA